MRLALRYDADSDRLAGRAVPTDDADAREWVEVDGRLRLGLDRQRQHIVAFTIDRARHFVNFHPIWRFFGDEAVREVAAFQSSAVEQGDAIESTVEIDVPKRHRREVRGLLRSHLVG
jgi:hypothetical protein